MIGVSTWILLTGILIVFKAYNLTFILHFHLTTTSANVRFQPTIKIILPAITKGGGGGVPTTVWRFQTRQQSYDSFTATLTILGCSGSQLEVKYHIQCGGQGGRTSRPILFLENRLQRLSMIQLRLHQRFGIELEIEVTSSVDSISNALISELKEGCRLSMMLLFQRLQHRRGGKKDGD